VLSALAATEAAVVIIITAARTAAIFLVIQDLFRVSLFMLKPPF
jgi:hypothetical protein